MGKILSSAEIGAKIKAFRLFAGLTQEGLAEKLEITFQQVQKYERGVTKVNLTKLQQLADVLEVPISAFFDNASNAAYQLTEQELSLMKGFRKMHEDHKRNVVEIVSGLAALKT